MKRSVWIAIGVVVVVLLLAGAAFVGGRLLNRQGLLGRGSGPMMMIRSGEGGTMQSVELELSDELPSPTPEAAGLFLRREDNSIFVNETTGEGFRISIDEDGSTSTNAGDRETEVVVTNETVIQSSTPEVSFQRPD